jgi:hypothetical protein
MSITPFINNMRFVADMVNSIGGRLGTYSYRCFLCTSPYIEDFDESKILFNQPQPTFEAVEIGHLYNGQIYAPCILETYSSSIFKGGFSEEKLTIKSLIKPYSTSTQSGGYDESFLDSTNGNQKWIQLLDTTNNITKKYQITSIHEYNSIKIVVEIKLMPGQN